MFMDGPLYQDTSLWSGYTHKYTMHSVQYHQNKSKIKLHDIRKLRITYWGKSYFEVEKTLKFK